MAPLVEARRDGRLGEREAASVARHVAGCAECRALERDLDEIGDLLRARRDPAPAPLEHQRSRLALLRAAASPPPASRRPAALAALAAAACLALGTAALLPRAPDPAPLAARIPRSALRLPERTATTVQSSPGARFERAAAGSVERVDLWNGTLDLAVRKLAPGERFMVATSDAEVEVRGTIFAVEAREGRIASVSVTEGKVEVRYGGAISVLTAGGAWRPPANAAPPVAPASADAPPAPAPAPAPVVMKTPLPSPRRAVAPSPVAASTIAEHPRAPEMPAPTASASAPRAMRGPLGEPSSPPKPPAPPKEVAAVDPASQAFAGAVRVLERGDYASAAERLDAFQAAHPGDARAEDAAFLVIVSLQRAGRRADAIAAAKSYLARYPRGDRRAEAEAVAAGR